MLWLWESARLLFLHSLTLMMPTRGGADTRSTDPRVVDVVDVVDTADARVGRAVQMTGLADVARAAVDSQASPAARTRRALAGPVGVRLRKRSIEARAAVRLRAMGYVVATSAGHGRTLDRRTKDMVCAMCEECDPLFSGRPEELNASEGVRRKWSRTGTFGPCLDRLLCALCFRALPSVSAAARRAPAAIVDRISDMRRTRSRHQPANTDAFDDAAPEQIKNDGCCRYLVPCTYCVLFLFTTLFPLVREIQTGSSTTKLKSRDENAVHATTLLYAVAHILFVVTCGGSSLTLALAADRGILHRHYFLGPADHVGARTERALKRFSSVFACLLIAFVLAQSLVFKPDSPDRISMLVAFAVLWFPYLVLPGLLKSRMVDLVDNAQFLFVLAEDILQRDEPEEKLFRQLLLSTRRSCAATAKMSWDWHTLVLGSLLAPFGVSVLVLFFLVNVLGTVVTVPRDQLANADDLMRLFFLLLCLLVLVLSFFIWVLYQLSRPSAATYRILRLVDFGATPDLLCQTKVLHLLNEIKRMLRERGAVKVCNAQITPAFVIRVLFYYAKGISLLVSAFFIFCFLPDSDTSGGAAGAGSATVNGTRRLLFL